MDAVASLEARIHSLEKSRDRSRRAAWALALLLALVSVVAMVPQAPEEVRTQRLVLVQPSPSPVDSGVVLLAGPQGSLLIHTMDGSEIARFGGPAARHIR